MGTSTLNIHLKQVMSMKTLSIESRMWFTNNIKVSIIAKNKVLADVTGNVKKRLKHSARERKGS